MMKSVFLKGITLGIVLASSAYAAATGFSGNTIHVKTPGFGELYFAMDEDGTFQRSDGVSGTWTYDGATLCYHVEAQKDLCGAFDGSKKVGDHWEDAAWDGEGTAQIHLMPGVELPAH